MRQGHEPGRIQAQAPGHPVHVRRCAGGNGSLSRCPLRCQSSLRGVAIRLLESDATSLSPGVGPRQSTCNGAALALLAARARSEEDLRRRLVDRGFSAAEVAATLAGLVESGALVEKSSAELFVRLRRHRWGRERLELELRRRLFKEESIRGALADIGVDEESALAARLAGVRTPDRLDPAEQRRLFARLRRKGISAPVAIRALRREAGDED